MARGGDGMATYSLAGAARSCALGVLLCSVFVTALPTLHAKKPSAQRSTMSSGLFTEAQAIRGDALYAENCAQCHRFDLNGGDQAPPLVGQVFTLRWTGKPLSELFDYMRAEMPLNSPGGLSSEQNADLLAFLLKKSGYATGTMDLSASSEKLASLRLPAPSK